MGQDVSYQPYPHSVLDGVVVAATRTMPFSAPHNTPRAAGTHATVVAPSMSVVPRFVPATRLVPQEGPDDDSEHCEREAPPKLPSDGYRWRKYGRKIVNGQARHYYRCTTSGCDAKRQVSWRGTTPDINKIGEHNHSAEGKSCIVVRPEMEPALKKHAAGDDIPLAISLNDYVETQARNLQYRARVPVSNQGDDGFIWMTRTSPPTRDQQCVFLRCTFADCPVEKDVVAEEGGFCTITYRGMHNHSKPFMSLSVDPKSDSSTSSSERPSLDDIYNAIREIGDV